MKTKEEIEKQLELSYKELNRIAKNDPVGRASWRMQKRYCDALEWVLGF